MADDFGKPDGLGVVNDHDVLARQLEGIEKTLKATRGNVKHATASRDLNATLASIAVLKGDIKLTRKRLVQVEQFILGLSRFADSKALKKLLASKDAKTKDSA